MVVNAKFCLVGSILTLSLLGGLICHQNVFAYEYSWSLAEPTIYSSEEVANVSYSHCRSYSKIISLFGDADVKKACVFDGPHVSVATYFELWNGFMSAVKFANDNYWYKLASPCTVSDICTYVPSKDMMIIKEHLVSNMVSSLVIYKNFSERLRSESVGLSQRYVFDGSSPDYIFQSDYGYAWPIGGVGVSSNGDWLALEIRGRGIGLLNLDDMSMKRISMLSFGYGYGMDPASELAVSNDGKHIALMGMNSGLSIFDIDESCGESVTDERLLNQKPLDIPCKEARIDFPKIINRFFAGLYPRFDTTGGELNFFALSYSDNPREVVLRVGNYIDNRVEYIALGDSYTSGEGETDDKYYLAGTNKNYEKCHLSIRSYPFILANLQGIRQDKTKSVACSGAETVDIVGENSTYFGQSGRLKALGYDESSLALIQTEAKYLFTPGRVPQSDFVGLYRPALVTVGIGGNDAKLMDKLGSCASLGTCDWASDPQKKEQSANEIKSLFGKLVSVYAKLHVESPKSKIYAVGYPRIIDKGGSCGLLNNILNSTEVEYADESISYLNDVISNAAMSAGIGYLDIYNAFDNRVLCGEAGSYVNGIRLGNDIKYHWFTIIGQEGFHPNPDGHEAIASYIQANYGSLLSYNYCADGSTYCPNENIMAPTFSNYWIPSGMHDYPALRSANLVEDSSSSVREISLSSGSLRPGTIATVQLHSDVQTLGEFIAAADGSLTATVDLPDDASEGYHTISVVGTSYSGEPIELYQIISYRSDVSEDTSGVSDTSDASLPINNVSVATKSVAADANQEPAKSKKPAPQNIGSEGLINGVETVFHPAIKGASDSKSVSTKPAKTTSGANHLLVCGCIILVDFIIALALFARLRRPHS